MLQGICNQDFYGELVYFKKITGNPNFSNLFKRIVNCFKRAGYHLDRLYAADCMPSFLHNHGRRLCCTL